jgi:hypothetical protein
LTPTKAENEDLSSYFNVGMGWRNCATRRGLSPLEESKDLDNEKRCDNDYEKDKSAQSASLHLLHAFWG